MTNYFSAPARRRGWPGTWAQQFSCPKYVHGNRWRRIFSRNIFSHTVNHYYCIDNYCFRHWNYGCKTAGFNDSLVYQTTFHIYLFLNVGVSPSATRAAPPLKFSIYLDETWLGRSRQSLKCWGFFLLSFETVFNLGNIEKPSEEQRLFKDL